MELAGKVLSGILGLIVYWLVASFLVAWWEQRKRRKNKGGEVDKQSTAGQQ